ncbi:MAG: hypothetical protein KJO69_09400 [Gammaproteobacteria bacterium]|nr:hypothetical protein [Gammaproteobacteria bacterium]
MCTINHLDNCPPSLDFPSKLCHTNSMNKEQLIALVTKRYHEQLKREYNYRQAIRDGSIQPFDAKTIEYWDIADNH